MSSTSIPTVPPAGATAIDADDDAGLKPLRAELDRIDDAMHALLRQRAAVVAEVARAKAAGTGTVALRPGREAAILRRLLATHDGDLPPVALIRIWRELFAATTGMQGRFVISVCETDRDREMTACAREHFGAATKLHAFHTPAEAIAEVSSGVAAAAVLPMPAGESDTDNQSMLGGWWTSLVTRQDPRLHIVARLPFWAPRAEGAPSVEALVVSAAFPDPSGNDCSLLGMEVAADLSRGRLHAALVAGGWQPQRILLHRRARAVFALAEVEGFVTEGDPRLAALPGLGQPAIVLGAYACPEGVAA